LENPTFSLDGKLYTVPSFDASPGGITHHRTYRGEYLEHVVATKKVAFSLYDVEQEVYGDKVDKDFVTAGVLLHDIFKPVTYTMGENGEFSSAPLADYLDHISLATELSKKFPRSTNQHSHSALRQLWPNQTRNHRGVGGSFGGQRGFPVEWTSVGCCVVFDAESNR
jgi:hypothetical protein